MPELSNLVPFHSVIFTCPETYRKLIQFCSYKSVQIYRNEGSDLQHSFFILLLVPWHVKNLTILTLFDMVVLYSAKRVRL